MINRGLLGKTMARAVKSVVPRAGTSTARPVAQRVAGNVAGAMQGKPSQMRRKPIY
jgi:hypothetical protein